MKKLSNLSLLIIHVGLGTLAYFFHSIPFFLVIGVSLYAFHRIFSKRNKDEFAAIAAGYVVSLEVLNRMLKSGLPWEYGKYAIVVLLLVGITVEIRKNPLPPFSLIYLLCLFPSFLVLDFSDISEIRDEASFNLSGPLALGVSVMYFYKRRLDLEGMRKILFGLLLGFVSTMTVVLLRMPSLENVQFYHVSNYTTSGGFGPNQVSTMLGLCFLVIGFAWYVGINVTTIGILDKWIGAIAIVMAILTFSRGGVIVPAIVMFLCAIVMAVKSSNPKQFVRAIWIVGVLSVTGGIGYVFVNSLTGDALNDRYNETQVTERTEFNDRVTVRGLNLSGRESIFLADMLVFAEQPFLGTGPGGGKAARERVGGVYIADHTEQSRLLAEHGMYGLIALLILIIAPFNAFRSAPNLQSKIVVLTFTLFTFLTMMHAATRLGTISFIYGLGFAVLLSSFTNPLMKAPTSEG